LTKIAIKLCSWLEEIQSETDSVRLAKLCYRARRKQMEQLNQRASQNDSFRDLSHLIGRLGAHPSAISTITSAFLEVPSLQQISKVRLVPSAKPRMVILNPKCLNAYKAIQRIGINNKLPPPEVERLLNSFLTADRECGVQQKMDSNGTFNTIIHAELLLVDLFSRRNKKFVDD